MSKAVRAFPVNSSLLQKPAPSSSSAFISTILHRTSFSPISIAPSNYSLSLPLKQHRYSFKSHHQIYLSSTKTSDKMNSNSALTPTPAPVSSVILPSTLKSLPNPQDALHILLPSGSTPGVTLPADFDLTSSDYYFNSYAHFGIHEEMLKDETRTLSYRRAILDNPHLFRGKVVLDVGCGTGVLSMFAAQAGATKVYAVECSKIVDQCRQIVKANGFDNVVEVVEGKIEEIQLPEHVDIIISEWMGYFLFYESMLDTVLYARDKWLKPNGLIFPDKTNLYLCAIEDADYRAQKIDFWDSVYGFDMTAIKHIALTEPLVDVVEPQQVLSSNNPCPVFSVDIATVRKQDLKFVAPFKIVANRRDFCHALVAYFDVQFTHCHKPVVFNTGPQYRPTHWKQTVFYLDTQIAMEEGEFIQGVLACQPNAKNPRDLDIAISYQVDGKHANFANILRYRLR